MKKSKLIIAVSFLTLVLVMNRFADKTQAAKNQTSIYKQIENQIQYPEIKNGEKIIGKVVVEFKCNEKGKVEILNLSYSNERLKKYVTQKLANMTIQLPTDNSDDVYKVEFSFI